MSNLQPQISTPSAYPRAIEEQATASTRSVVRERNTPRDSFRAELREHQYRVGEMARMLATRVGFTSHQAATIGQAAALHDIGKLFMPSAIFQKSGPLSPAEEAEARTHTTRGHWALMRGHDPISRLAARIAIEHHEHWDGGGYPNSLSGTEICREARVVTICDVYVALREERSYKTALNHDEAMSIMLCGDKRVRPTMFDPTILAVFLMHGELFRKWWDGSSASVAAAS